MRKHVFLFLSVLIAGIAKSQQLYFNHLSVNNGLSQGVNNCIYRDSKGFIWISSFDGLNRFDGIQCTSFRSSLQDSAGLKGTLFLNILEDKETNLWIGSNEGLNFYSRKLNRFFNFRVEMRKDAEQFYSPFFIDDKNQVWLQSRSDILVFDPAGKKFKELNSNFTAGNLLVKTDPQQLYTPLKKIFVINNNTPVLWMGDIKDNQANWSSANLMLSDLRINTILLSPAGVMWLGTNKGLYKYALQEPKTQPLLFRNSERYNISVLQQDQSGSLWIGTLQTGLLKTDTATNVIQEQYISSAYNTYSLSGNHVQYIYHDAYGNLWVSIWGKGVDYTNLHKFRFTHFVTKEEAVQSGADNFIRSVIQVNNETWCGTQTGGILVLDENKKIKLSLRKGLPPAIEHLYADADNKIWIATFTGLFTADPVTKVIQKLQDDNEIAGPSRQFNYICPLKKDQLLLSTNAGLFVLKKTKHSYHVKAAKGITRKDVFLTTCTDANNRIYISSAFKGFGVYRMQADSFILIKEFPVQATIKCFSEAADSIIWIGSTIGLLQFNKNSLTIQRIFRTDDGLSNHYIYGIVPDGNDLWLSTNAGINRFHTKNFSVKAFNAGDGLQSNEYNTYAFYKSAGNEILFGGVNGLNAFVPAGLKKLSFAPQLALTALQLNDTAFNPGTSYSELKSLILDYSQNTISLQFTVIDYAKAEAGTISYMLQGYDKSPVIAVNKSYIRYANLPSGRYELKVKAINAEGIEAKQVFILPLTIKTPWWQSLWFRLLLLLITGFLIFTFIRNYISRKLEKQKAEYEKQQALEKERNRISRDMHDDLGSGLTKIAILSEVAKQQITNPDKAKEQLNNISSSSRELVDSLQDIIWVLNPQNDTLDSLASYIREYALKFFEPLSVEVKFQYPAEFSSIKLGEEKRRNIFLTVKESFNNIAKHAWCNKIELTITEASEKITIHIEDDGKGFNELQVRQFANGLKNMQNRIEQIGGQYNITSNPGKGTITTISVYI